MINNFNEKKKCHVVKIVSGFSLKKLPPVKKKAGQPSQTRHTFILTIPFFIVIAFTASKNRATLMIGSLSSLYSSLLQ